MDWTKNARGGADVKLIIAMLFAVGGLSWAVVAAMGIGKERNDNQGPRIVEDAVIDDEGNQVDASYT